MTSVSDFEFRLKNRNWIEKWTSEYEQFMEDGGKKTTICNLVFWTVSGVEFLIAVKEQQDEF